MAKYRYEKYLNQGYGISPGMIAFSLSPDPKKHERRLTVPWATCRDHISDAVIAEVNGKDNWNHKSGDPRFDFNKLRLLVTAAVKDKPFIFAGKEILNIYEKVMGFTGRSKIVSVDVEGTTDATIGAWLITGPKEWMKCTQLISMCTVILRICLSGKAQLDGVKTLDDLEQKVWSNLKGITGHRNDVDGWLPFMWPKWRVLAENFGKIFHRLGPKTLYPAEKVGSWHSSGGILYMCKHATGIDQLDERFKTACQEAGIKQMDYNGW